MPLNSFKSLTATFIFLSFALPALTAFGQLDETLPPVSEPAELFNGQDLQGWNFFTQDDSIKVEDVFTVEDGVLKCTGRPAGYLQTRRWYRDYEFSVEWRWTGKKGGNSGVLIHCSVPLLFAVWPQSLECQLRSGAAGEFWVIGKEVEIDVENADKRRVPKVAGNQHKHRRVKRLESDPENPIGEWNTMRIIANDDVVTVYVNDVLVNQGDKLHSNPRWYRAAVRGDAGRVSRDQNQAAGEAGVRVATLSVSADA